MDTTAFCAASFLGSVYDAPDSGGSLLACLAPQPPGEKRKVQSKYSRAGAVFSLPFGTPAGRGCVTCVRLLPPSVLTLSLHLHGPLPGPSRSSLHLPSSPHSLPDALHPACSVPLNYEESQATRGSPWFRGNAAFFFLICSRSNFFWFHHREILQTACPWGVCSLNSFPF